MSALDAWYREERAAIPRLGTQGSLLLGGVAYGEHHIGLFADYCLPSLLAPANRAALQGAAIVLYTDDAGAAPLDGILRAAWHSGIAVALLRMPEAVMQADMRLFLRIAAAQSLLVQTAVKNGAAFHMLMPDHVYSERYFPNLMRVAKTYPNIVHGGLNVSLPGAARRVDRWYRRYWRCWRGELEIPADVLATIAWHNTVMCAMNGNTPDRMPDEHYHVWRARDRVMLFNPYANPVHITPEVGKLMDGEKPTTGTLDTHVQRLFGTDFYVPTAADDMAFIALSDAKPIPANNFTDRATFLKRCWVEIGHREERLVYYTTPTELGASIDESAPTAEQIMQSQRDLVDEMIAQKDAA